MTCSLFVGLLYVRDVGSAERAGLACSRGFFDITVRPRIGEGDGKSSVPVRSAIVELRSSKLVVWPDEEADMAAFLALGNTEC